MKIVFASWNAKKSAEIQRMAPKNIEIICLKDVLEAEGIPQANENGKSFIENAIIKAEYWSKVLGMAVLAEDSGIKIDILDGYPGVRTKRCIEELCQGSNVNEDKPSELYPLLLKLMRERGESTSAEFVCSMALIDGDKRVYAKDVLKGNMCDCAGEREFGFDQYFKPEGFEKTLAELAPEEKDKIAPRKYAFECILRQL